MEALVLNKRNTCFSSTETKNYLTRDRLAHFQRQLLNHSELALNDQGRIAQVTGLQTTPMPVRDGLQNRGELAVMQAVTSQKRQESSNWETQETIGDAVFEMQKVSRTS